MATWTKIKEFKENTQNTVTKKEVQFTVAEEGNYVICFNFYRIGISRNS